MRYCFCCDLIDDKNLIALYEQHHQHIWPEIKASIKNAGIENMEIFRAGNRLFMVIEADESFSPEAKAAADAANPKVQEWENLMWKYQQALPFAQPGEKWVRVKRIFKL